MLFNLTLYISLGICGLGLLYQFGRWFTLKLGEEAQTHGPGERLAQALAGIFKSIFGPGIVKMAVAFVVDVLLLRRVWRESSYRWLMHMCIFYGFMGLLLFHALEKQVSLSLFAGYSPTINPFLFLRNLFGALVLVGVGMAIWRRATNPGVKRTTNWQDKVSIVLLAVIMLSGIALEAVKIPSPDAFKRMVNDYGMFEGEELKSLQLYWQEEFGSSFPGKRIAMDKDVFAQGKDLHQQACASCHSKPQVAFLSYPISRIFAAGAGSLDFAGWANTLRIVHFLACFIGLAFLPFSKFFHIITSTLCLLTASVLDPKTAHPANLATARAMWLTACTHCSTCTINCSVRTHQERFGVSEVLPSEKLAAYCKSAGKGDAQSLADLRLGDDLCTRCHRCTEVCPVGINLQELWFGLAQDLDRLGPPALYEQARARAAAKAEKWDKTDGKAVRLVRKPLPKVPGWPDKSAFRYCFQCQTCTNSCPVVASFERPMDHLDMLPHQIMHSLGLSMLDNAAAAAMTWQCLTCYNCQEACPQGVPVTDVLYGLRNLSFALPGRPKADTAA